MSCGACEVVLQDGHPEELHPACRTGQCGAPPPLGLGVVRLDPRNAVAVRAWRLCATLGPALAMTLLPAGLDRALLADQLDVLVEAWGAPWLRPASA